MYKYYIERKLKKKLKKISKKDKKFYEIVINKIEEIIENPSHYKPLRYNLKALRRVHVDKSFVIIFEIDEENEIVRFLDLDHHDRIYKK
ncbi:MAG: type II toxin-antitoxin system mRNA interferase toxin, RelE/StbE family [Archaeoglobaceae archaeon]